MCLIESAAGSAATSGEKNIEARGHRPGWALSTPASDCSSTIRVVAGSALTALANPNPGSLMRRARHIIRFSTTVLPAKTHS
jgi:hypothetical protein